MLLVSLRRGLVTADDVTRLLNQLGGLNHPCDLDLLLFLARHPRTLATSEQLGVWLGYELKQIASSLDLLLDRGLLTRTQTSAHAARLYTLVDGGSGGGWLSSLLQFASTRQGRLALRKAIVGRPGSGNPPTARTTRTMNAPVGRPYVVRRRAGQTSSGTGTT